MTENGQTEPTRRRRRESTARGAVDTAHPALEPTPPPTAPPVGHWGPDFLGDGYEARTYPQPDDDEGAVVTTLVRHLPDGESLPAQPRLAVLYVHGWGDYFLQTELAEFWAARGAVFYAVDLRKCGRSLRPHQTRCFVESLTEYDADLDLAVEVIRSEHGSDLPLLLVAHSQGGLTSSLWAARRPGTVCGLVLNAPFLEMHGSSFARAVSHPLVSQVARRQARWPVPIPGPDFYDRTIRVEYDGEWEIETAWRPLPTHPIRPGWLNAVMHGHKQVKAGLGLPVPILVLTSHQTVIGPRWRESMRHADVVLDVKQLWKRAPDLGDVVTLVKVTDAVHDVLLSPHPVRDRAYEQIDHWFRGYIEPEL